MKKRMKKFQTRQHVSRKNIFPSPPSSYQRPQNNTPPQNTIPEPLISYRIFHHGERTSEGTSLSHIWENGVNSMTQIEAQQKALAAKNKGGNSILKKDKGHKFQCVRLCLPIPSLLFSHPSLHPILLHNMSQTRSHVKTNTL